MHHQSVFSYAKYRYLKLALALCAVCIALYAFDRPPFGRNGGTAVGYALGTASALMVLWLLWFGVRKRRFRRGSAVLGWLSAHVYLGLALVVVATLHAAFEIGWNVHSLAYVLMIGVIASGLYGIYFYVRVPRLMTENMGEDSIDSLLIKIADLDRQARAIALALPDDINTAVLEASRSTRIGGGWRAQLRRQHPDCATASALELIRRRTAGIAAPHAGANQQLYAVLLRKQEVLTRARRDIRLKALLDAWLYLHVPLSIALLAALVAHVVSVFFYW